MRAALLAVVLGVVLVASALNLVLGVWWLVALSVLAVARRRSGLGVALPWLVLVLVAGLAALGAPRGWLEPRPVSSYADDELAGLRRLWRGSAAPEAGEHGILAARIRALQAEERATVPAEVERRAGAAVAFVRDAGRLRAKSFAETGALEAAVRRLAFTLTSPEFHDLDDRRTRAERLLAALEERLAATGPGDAAGLAAIRRALDPAALASVSLTAVRDDLRQVDEATWAVIRALGGREPTARAATAVSLDDSRGELILETRYELTAGAGTRIGRLDPASARRALGSDSSPGMLTLEVAGERGRELASRGDVVLEPGASKLALVARQARPLRAARVAAPFRRIGFAAVEVPSDREGEELGRLLAHVLIGVHPEGWPGAEPLLAVSLPVPEVATVASPARSLFWIGAGPGSTSPEAGRDVWRPAGKEPVRLPFGVELAPASRVFRNRLFAGVAPYLYRAGVATVLGIVALAATTLALAARASAPAPA